MTTQVDTSNYVPLAMTAHGWAAGKGTTPYATVVRRLRSEWGGTHWKKHGYTLYLVHPGFEINEVNGSVLTPIIDGYHHKPIKIDDHRPVVWSRDGDQYVGTLVKTEARLTRYCGALGDEFIVKVGDKHIANLGGGDPKTLLKRAKAKAEEALKWPDGKPEDALTGKVA